MTGRTVFKITSKKNSYYDGKFYPAFYTVTDSRTGFNNNLAEAMLHNFFHISYAA